MSKKQQKQLAQIEDKKRASRLRKLGWEEVEGWQHELYRWRCAKCKNMKLHVDCGMCFRCEACYKCEPDTKAGKKALKNYVEKGQATCDFDIYGIKL